MPTYTPARPGHRPKRCTTAAARRNFVAANTRKRCSAVGCTSFRKWTSSYCSNHKGRVAAHGHPEGGSLDAGLVGTYRAKFAKWLELYEDTGQCRAALEVMDALLRGKLIKRRSYAQRELRRLREGERHPGDHATGPTTAREALEIVGGVYWLSLYRSDELHDDVRLTYALATYLFKAKVLEARPRVSRTSGQAYFYRPRAAATAKQDVGGVIRRDLAVFFINAWNRAEDDHRADVDRRMALKEPMASVTGAPAPAHAQPTPATPTLGHVEPTPTPRAPTPTPAPATMTPTSAELIERSRAVLKKTDAVLAKTAPGALRPYDPSGPSRQAPYDPSKGPTAPTAGAAGPEATPLPPTASVLAHVPKTTANDPLEPTAHDPDALNTFGTPTGERFEDFSR